jgi:hypothetical protein
MQLSKYSILILIVTGCASQAQQQCTALFDGHSLNGWQLIGDANITVEDGVIIGRAVHGIPNSFLRTELVYGDFDLRLEFKVDAGFNSGVQFRSAQAVGPRQWSHQAGNGQLREITNEPGQVFGYQAEIDPSERGWTAEIYEERARGWLQTFAKEPAARQIETDTWHRLRIRANGDSIQTWLDGSPVADLTDSMRADGFIALQVHAVRTPEDAGKTVRFNNIQLCDVVE